MKTSRLLTAVALATLFAAGAHAEQYQGVLQFDSSASRADVRAQAVVAAHGDDPYREGAHAGVAPQLVRDADRAGVRAQAFAAARAGNLYGDAAGAGVERLAGGTVDRAAVRAQARATAARGVTEGSL